MSKRLSRPARLGLVTTMAAVLVSGGVWASFQVLAGPERDSIGEVPYVLAESAPGVVEQSLRLNTSASWSPSATIANQATGLVTEIAHEPGVEINAGDLLYTADLKPVIAAEGAIPAFRALNNGDTGEDVAQLQRLLAAEGHFDGEADGKFDYRTHWAVRAWQEDLGITATGTVEAGTVLFLPQLPARATLAADIKVGSAVSPGTAAVELLPDSPDFSIALAEGHARTVQAGMTVDIDSGEGTWSAVVTDVQSGEHDQYVAHLAAAEGTICGDDCGLIPLGDPTLLPSTIHVVPSIEGITVPAGAVATGADGRTVVITGDGEEIEVDVVAGANGMVVVEGIDAGLTVRLPNRAGE